jgi:hypothetical protein
MKFGKHEIFSFIETVGTEMAAEYDRIRSRALEDPGTAGDEAEENWAELLRGWLPANFPVVTKGRILNHLGEASPQVDIIVLSPTYPLRLRDKKLYFAGGVVAAFECKLTLRTQHFLNAFQNCKLIKNMLPNITGSPQEELYKPIIYGLIAHSCNLKSNIDKNIFHLVDQISKYDREIFSHPSEMIDIICIADTVSFEVSKTIHIGPMFSSEDVGDAFDDIDPNGGISTGYTAFYSGDECVKEWKATVLGSFIAYLIFRIALEEPSVRMFSEYMDNTGISGIGIGQWHPWPSNVLSEGVVQRIIQEGCENGLWSKWRQHL